MKKFWKLYFSLLIHVFLLPQYVEAIPIIYEVNGSLERKSDGKSIEIYGQVQIDDKPNISNQNFPMDGTSSRATYDILNFNFYGENFKFFGQDGYMYIFWPSPTFSAWDATYRFSGEGDVDSVFAGDTSFCFYDDDLTPYNHLDIANYLTLPKTIKLGESLWYDQNYGYETRYALSPLSIGSNTLWLTQVSPVPEPSTLVLLGAGLAGLAAWHKKRS